MLIRRTRILRDHEPQVLPDKLYKFLAPTFARALCESGGVRVGTLHDYRNAEKHGYGVLDMGEATMQHREIIKQARADQMTGWTRAAFSGTHPTVEFLNGTIETSLEAPDTYVYCLSMSSAWNSIIDPSYTACVEIVDVGGFVRELQRFMLRKGLVTQRIANGAAVYAGRHHTTRTDGDIHVGGPPAVPALLKPFKDRPQREYRFMFEPVSLPIEPVNGKHPPLAKLCRFHSTRP